MTRPSRHAPTSWRSLRWRTKGTRGKRQIFRKRSRASRVTWTNYNLNETLLPKSEKGRMQILKRNLNLLKLPHSRNKLRSLREKLHNYNHLWSSRRLKPKQERPKTRSS